MEALTTKLRFAQRPSYPLSSSLQSLLCRLFHTKVSIEEALKLWEARCLAGQLLVVGEEALEVAGDLCELGLLVLDDPTLAYYLGVVI